MGWYHGRRSQQFGGSTMTPKRSQPMPLTVEEPPRMMTTTAMSWARHPSLRGDEEANPENKEVTNHLARRPRNARPRERPSQRDADGVAATVCRPPSLHPPLERASRSPRRTASMDTTPRTRRRFGAWPPPRRSLERCGETATSTSHRRGAPSDELVRVLDYSPRKPTRRHTCLRWPPRAAKCGCLGRLRAGVEPSSSQPSVRTSRIRQAARRTATPRRARGTTQAARAVPIDPSHETA